MTLADEVRAALRRPMSLAVDACMRGNCLGCAFPDETDEDLLKALQDIGAMMDDYRDWYLKGVTLSGASGCEESLAESWAAGQLLWTDYPLLPSEKKAPWRQVRFVRYDGDKYADVIHPDYGEHSIKVGYLYPATPPVEVR